jgi:citrate lyase subunit beta/citryl-CoA lyase
MMPEAARPLPKSFLYVPANKPGLFDKAAASGAEALILDLEDSVPAADKVVARREAQQWLRNGPMRPPTWVRINAESIEQDVDALAGATYDGIVLAKAEVAALEVLDAKLGGRTPVIGLIESALGLLQLSEITAMARVATLGIGEVDLLADLRIRRSQASEAAIDGLRMRIVIACAAAGLSAPVAPTSTDFRDLGAFAASTRKLMDLGFRSRTAIHPDQCAVINEALEPGPADLAAAETVLARFADAGDGVALDASGRLIDAAVVRHANEIISRVSVRNPAPTN